MQNQLLHAEKRNEKHIDKPGRLRGQGWVPGVVYGKGLDSSINLKVKTLDLKKFLLHSGKIFEVEVKGSGKHLVSLDTVQKDHLGDHILHVAFHKIEANRKTVITLPIHFKGSAEGQKVGGIVQHVLSEVDVKGLPKDMPEFIEVDVTALELNHHWTLGDIKPPVGLEWHQSLTDNVVSCHMPRVIEEESPAVEETVVAGGEEAPAAESPDSKDAA